MRFAALLALLALAPLAGAQTREPRAVEEKPAAKKDAKAQDERQKPKPRPRIGIKKNGSVGDDASGGGGRSGASSMGGTPGTPSGSFTRP